MAAFSPETYVSRRQGLKENIGEGIILFLGNENASINFKANHYPFRQDSSFLYFYGIDMPDFAATFDIESGEEIIFADDFTADDIIWMGEQPLVKDLIKRCKVNKSQSFKNLFSYLERNISYGRKIHFLPPYRDAHSIFLNTIFKGKTTPSTELIRAVVRLREIKSSEEIVEIEKACDIGYDMHLRAMKMAKPGVSENTITVEIEKIAKENGYGTSFPIILSQNGHILHNHSHEGILQKGRLLLVDAGAETFAHYASDFTRTTPVGGEFSQKQQEVYQIVLAANEKAASMIRPGIRFYDIHLAACRVIAEGLKSLNIMKNDVDEALAKGAHALFMPHGLGHMMGLDVHDMENLGEDWVGYSKEVKRSRQFGTAYLRLGKRLQEGFVLTNEPGIYFIPMLIRKWKNEKLHTTFINYDKLEKEYLDFGGIRLEDDILVTKTGFRYLGKKRLPITLKELKEVAQSS